MCTRCLLEVFQAVMESLVAEQAAVNNACLVEYMWLNTRGRHLRQRLLAQALHMAPLG